MRISQVAFDMIIREEVSSKALYEQRYQRPVLPGAASGITVGIGYDLGYHTRDQIASDWLGRVPAHVVSAMQRYAGLTKDRARSVLAAAKASIVVPWDAAISQFRDVELPRWEQKTINALPGAENLPPDCLGALVSLTYNRGPSYTISASKDPSGRYREMRAIRAAIMGGDLEEVPGLIRSMKRLWPNLKGLQRRRESEADLFEKGLASARSFDSAVEDIENRYLDPEGEIDSELTDDAFFRNEANIRWVQERLRELGYYSVGEPDGQMPVGGRTEEAIMAYRRARGLPITPNIDQELLDELAKAQYPREVSPTRKEADAKEVAKKVPSVLAALRGKIAAAWAFISTLVVGFISWLADQFESVWETIKPMMKWLGTIPAPLWFLAAAVVIGFMYWQYRKAVEEAKSDYNSGRLL